VCDAVLARAAQDNWSGLMRDGLDVTGRGTGPYVNASPVNLVFYVLVAVFGTLLGRTVLAARFVETYMHGLRRERARAAARGLGIVSRRVLPALRDPPPGGTLLRDLLRRPEFETAMSLCFLLQFLAMCADPAYKPDALARRLAAVNDAFLALVVGMEAWAKTAALGGAGVYMRDPYNRLDFLAGLATFAAIALQETQQLVARGGGFFGQAGTGVPGGPDLVFAAGVLRCLRLLRLPRVLLHFGGLARALAPLLESVSSLVPLVALHSVTLFVFGVLCTQVGVDGTPPPG
jgi:hypothetical protein